MHTIEETAQIGWEAYRESHTLAPRWEETLPATKRAYTKLAQEVVEWRKQFNHGGEDFAKQVFFAACVEWNGTREELWEATPQEQKDTLRQVLKRMLRATRP